MSKPTSIPPGTTNPDLEAAGSPPYATDPDINCGSLPEIGPSHSSATTDAVTALGDDSFCGAQLWPIDAVAISPNRVFSDNYCRQTTASDSIDPEIDRVLCAKARQLCRLRPFVSTDHDDLHQELRIAWLASAPHYDPSVGTVWPFLKTVVERTAAKLRAKAIALRRYAAGTVSVHQLTIPLGDGSPALTGEDHSQLKDELASAIQELPGPLAQLCRLLGDHSLAEISRSTAIPRSTVVARVAAIRRRFESKKLSKFL